MHRRIQTHIVLVHLMLDMATVSVALLLAYLLRFSLIPNAEQGLFFEFLKLLLLLLPSYLISYIRNGLYLLKDYSSWYQEVFAVAKANIEGFLTFFVVFYFVVYGRMSRLTFLIFGIIVITLAVIQRLLVRSCIISRRRKGNNPRRIVAIGMGERIEKYVQTLLLLPSSGIEIIGWIDSNGSCATYNIPEWNMEHLDSNSLDMAVISYPSRMYGKLNKVVHQLNHKYVPAMMIPDIQYDYLGIAIEEFEGLPIMKLTPLNDNLIGGVIKRAMDLAGSLLGLIILSPVFLFIALLIKLTSPGSAFYNQKRVTQDGRIFTMWKFRTMRSDAESTTGEGWTTKDDPRKTRIGAFLRRTSIDELPQLWNVLKGDMSLVGPRPERPVFVEQFSKENSAYVLRHHMRTGITGWAQVSGWRGDTSIEKRLEFDIHYVKNWSLLFDIKILFLTVFKGFINKNAY